MKRAMFLLINIPVFQKSNHFKLLGQSGQQCDTVTKSKHDIMTVTVGNLSNVR